MHKQTAYSIGTQGQKWSATERTQWLAQQVIKRSYHDQVVTKLACLPAGLQREQYGALDYDPERYPLFAVRSAHWDSNKKTILVTGGVHGYETSGVQGAIRFLTTQASRYMIDFNIIVTPCISPWGYETINRWNPYAVDPNRSFTTEIEASPAAESAALMRYIADLDATIYAHIDLHETTDSDNCEFRPALAARDAVMHENWNIPDGFYLVGDTLNPNADFQNAIIAAVSKVTHIAPADDSGRIIGEALAQFGVINYATKALQLCTGFSQCSYGTTTEVYPDSPLVDDENCTMAQVTAITAGLDYLLGLANG